MHSPMENIIKDLWHEYANEKYCFAQSDGEKELLSLIVKAEDQLRTDLSQHQTELLEEIIEHLHDMNSLNSQRAFESGIRFATSYILAALGGV